MMQMRMCMCNLLSVFDGVYVNIMKMPALACVIVRVYESYVHGCICGVYSHVYTYVCVYVR